MSEENLTGKALEKALREGIFDVGPSDLKSFDALVRKSEKKGHVGIGVAGCESFVDVSTDLIENAEKIGYVPCGGHGHPQMRITLKSSDDPIAQVLFQLLARVAMPADASAFARGFPANEAPGHDPVMPGMGAQSPPYRHGFPFGLDVPAVGGAAGGSSLPSTQNFNSGLPVCRWQVYPCGITLDPFRITWCRAYVCRYGGYDGIDIVVDGTATKI